jgi:16S rRNA (cytosine1402-N4)-methyltransferase
VNLHRSVLVQEVLAELVIKENGNYADVTLGGGGHSKLILQKLLDSGIKSFSLDCFDFDTTSWQIFKFELKKFGLKYESEEEDRINFGPSQRVAFHNCSFTNIGNLHKSYDFILADLGPSQNLLDDPTTGLSYRYDAPLDMRLDKSLTVSAKDLLTVLNKKQLTKLFKDYGGLSKALRLAESIIDSRRTTDILRTTQLNSIIIAGLGLDEESTVYKGKTSFSKETSKLIAKVYQALRIAVNMEYSNFASFLQESTGLLNLGGKLLAITFHSGEQVILDEHRKSLSNTKQYKFERKSPTQFEIESNSRSRSATLNVITRISA